MSYNPYYTTFYNEKVVDSTQKTGPKIVTMHKGAEKARFITPCIRKNNEKVVDNEKVV